MSAAEAALRSNATSAASAPPPTGGPVWTLNQETVAREFMETYGLERRQINFDSASEEPIFDSDALNTLSLALTDIASIRIEPGDFNNTAGIATAMCHVALPDGRSREVYGICLVGETMFDSTLVADLGQALKIAQTRALRNGLRAVNFDPVRAHKQGKTKQGPSVEFRDSRTTEIAELHLLGEQLRYIIGTDKTEWRKLLQHHFRVSSSADLSDLQRSQFLQMLRGLKRAQDSALASDATTE